MPTAFRTYTFGSRDDQFEIRDEIDRRRSHGRIKTRPPGPAVKLGVSQKQRIVAARTTKGPLVVGAIFDHGNVVKNRRPGRFGSFLAQYIVLIRS